MPNDPMAEAWKKAQEASREAAKRLQRSANVMLPPKIKDKIKTMIPPLEKLGGK